MNSVHKHLYVNSRPANIYMTGLLLETLLAGTSVYVNTIRNLIQKSPVVYFSRITAATEVRL